MKQEINKLLQVFKEQEIKFISFRFTDLEGKWQQITKITEGLNLDEIITFDGSSFEGWRGVENSDMYLVPDLKTFFIDPFSAQNHGVIICDVYDPVTKEPYDLDPRSIARKAEKFLLEFNIGDTAYFGPEPEFFIFDDVRFKTSPYESSYKIFSSESDNAFSKNIEGGNLGHRTGNKGGYCKVQPVDHAFDIRCEMASIMNEIGLKAELHHHEVAAGQSEIGFKYDELVCTGDNVQKYKYVVKNVASSFGKTATFMPKPIYGDNGSGMHVHQSIWRGGKNIFAGKEYAGLSEIALYYIGGIIKHSSTLALIANPTTNSYKRLLPGYEAPTMIAYSMRNRSAGIRIPHSEGDRAKRIEARFPDATSNPYLLFAALLMAGLDGIKNKIDPGEAREENLYKSHDVMIKKLPTSLEQALTHFESDHKFLLEGGVFTKNFVNSYMNIKRKYIAELQKIPHPAEFKMYYSF